jgi:hypothetical protein
VCFQTCQSAQSETQFQLVDEQGTIALFCASTISTFQVPLTVGGACSNVENAGAVFSAIDESVSVVPNAEGFIMMSASADVDIGAFPTTNVGNAAASVDPILSIDPSFPFASDFQIQFSADAETATAPEPSTMLLVLTATIASVFRGRRRGTGLVTLTRTRHPVHGRRTD